jgi:hypothetical protein
LTARWTRTEIGGYDSMREGAKGDKYFIIFYLPILVLVGENGYMSFLGNAMWCLIACNYINPYFGLFGVNHSFSLFPLSFVTHSFFIVLIHYFSWFGNGKQIMGREDPLFVGCKKLLTIPRGNGCMCA